MAGDEDDENCEHADTEDLDLHRWTCSDCGHVGYYSGAAKDYYEKGKKSPGVKGLQD